MDVVAVVVAVVVVVDVVVVHRERLNVVVRGERHDKNEDVAANDWRR